MCSLPFNPLLRNPLLNAQGFKHPAKSRRTVKKLLGQGVYESDGFYVLSRPPAVVGGGCNVFRRGMGEVFETTSLVEPLRAQGGSPRSAYRPWKMTLRSGCRHEEKRLP